MPASIIEPPPEPGAPPPPFGTRLAWFAGLAAASGLATAVGAYLLKALLG